MKYCSGSLFAMLAITILTGCASTGATPVSSTATETTTEPQAPAAETKAPAKSGGNAEPECD